MKLEQKNGRDWFIIGIVILGAALMLFLLTRCSGETISRLNTF